MQTVNISKELGLAINSLENLLNGKDGDFVLDAVKKYKKSKNLDNYTLLELRHRLSQ